MSTDASLLQPDDGGCDLQIASIDDHERQLAATVFTRFNEQVKNLDLDLALLAATVYGFSPPSRQIEVLYSQLDEVTRIFDKINQAAENVAEVERAGDQLLDFDYSSKTIQIREKVAELRETRLCVENCAKELDGKLHKALKALQNYNKRLECIGHVEREIALVGGPKEFIDELHNQIDLLKVCIE